VQFYDRGGLGPEDIPDAVLAEVGAERSSLIRPLGLTAAEIDAVVAFMKTTTADVRLGPGGIDLTAVPDRVPSGLAPPGMPAPEGGGPL
jgi:hypothetical protein